MENVQKKGLKMTVRKHLALMLFLAIVAVPFTSRAACCASNTQESTQQMVLAKEAASLIELITSNAHAVAQYALTLLGFSAVESGLRMNDMSEAARDKVDLKTNMKIGQAQMTQSFKNVQMANAADVLSNRVAGATSGLCYRIVLQNTPQIMEYFRKIVRRSVTLSLEGLYRDKMSDGAGPAAAAYDRKMRCKIGDMHFENGPSECVDPEMPPGLSISAGVLSGDYVLEMPPVSAPKKQGNVSYNAIPDNIRSMPLEQRYFAAAMHYCVHMMGTRGPTPQMGKPSPSDIVAMSRFSQRHSLQTSFFEECSNRLSRFTRPNATDANQEIFRNASRDACAAAKKFNIKLPPEFLCGGKTPNDEKEYRLTLDQVEYINQKACMASGYKVEEQNAGMKNDRSLMSSTDCQNAYNTWDTKREVEKAAFVKAADAVHQLNAY